MEYEWFYNGKIPTLQNLKTIATKKITFLIFKKNSNYNYFLENTVKYN